MELYLIWLTKIFHKYQDIYNFIDSEDVEKAFSSNSLNSEFPEAIKNKLFSSKLKDEAKYEYDYCLKNSIKLISFNSTEYPINLSHIPSPPPLLYCKGNILPKDECAISIVGSRKFTEYGRVATKKLSTELASSGVTIISGMALGIDTFAHTYALLAGGRTIAVLGSGINIVYPAQNKKLYTEIIENGAVISEFPINTPAFQQNFPIRNRIVAGLSLGTLVIEAKKKSGTMITAGLCGEYGRNVYAVPGSIFDSTSDGTNSLIKDGAKIVTTSQDILEDIYTEISQITPPKQLSLFTPANLSDKENKIYSLLSLTPILIDEIVTKTTLPLSEILETLTILELNGYVTELPGQKYVINA